MKHTKNPKEEMKINEKESYTSLELYQVTHSLSNPNFEGMKKEETEKKQRREE